MLLIAFVFAFGFISCYEALVSLNNWPKMACSNFVISLLKVFTSSQFLCWSVLMHQLYSCFDLLELLITSLVSHLTLTLHSSLLCQMVYQLQVCVRIPTYHLTWVAVCPLSWRILSDSISYPKRTLTCLFLRLHPYRNVLEWQ